ncbi:MAG: hypothetical protein P4L75_01600, partial [Clostridia bacterium]|nr:hypothetical protein [Clostridia bacterium]
YEKAQGLVDELVKKGEITISEGRELNEELKRKIDTQKAEMGSAPLTSELLKKTLDSLNLATKQDLDEIRQRIDNLEKK